MNKALISLVFVLLFVMGSCGGEGISCEVEGEARIVPCVGDENKQQRQICSQGEWMDKGFCYLCEENSKRTITCATDETMIQIQVCSSGDWVDQGTCCFCEENSKRTIPCSTDEALEQFQICSSGNWVDSGRCLCPESNKFCYWHDGLSWSDSDHYNGKYAIIFCRNLGGRLPTISELRTLIQNCPGTVTGGICGVTDSCLSYEDCYNNVCSGCSDDSSRICSVFGDSGVFWSSSERTDKTENAWAVDFDYGRVVHAPKYYGYKLRCVK